MYSIYLFLWGMFGVAAIEIYFKYYLGDERIVFLDCAIIILLFLSGPGGFIVLISNIPKK
jgi:hypothetical protein